MIIGKHSYIAYNNLKELFPEMGELVIGNFCSIAEDVVVHLGGDHNPRLISTFPFDHRLKWEVANDTCISKGNVIIGNDVWIGRSVKILGGVVIGDGAIVGAYSVVTKNIEPYEIWIGRREFFKRYRFPFEDVRKLLEMNWWYWDDEIIKDASRLLTSNNVNALYQYWKENVK